MKTAREILHEHYGRYGRSSEEGQILAMEAYKNQERVCQCKNPKTLGDFNSCADARCDECYGYITPNNTHEPWHKNFMRPENKPK